MLKSVAAAVLVLSCWGCASTDAQRATHYWESDNATSNRYQADEHSCQQTASEQTGDTDVFSVSSESYAAYRDCMVSRGYVLRQY